MKRPKLVAIAAVLALGGCGETESTIDLQMENSSISTEDMQAIKLHSACMISAVGLIGAYKLSKQNGQMPNQVADTFINTTATFAAYHEITRIDLTKNYNLSDDVISNTLKKATEDHLSKMRNLNNQEAAEFLRVYWSDNCMGPEASQGVARLRDSDAYSYSRDKFMDSQ